jgi:hypothetical protein
MLGDKELNAHPQAPDIYEDDFSTPPPPRRWVLLARLAQL